MIVEVVYALPQQQALVRLTVRAGTTAREAVTLSGLPLIEPGIDSAGQKLNMLGIFGTQVAPDTVLKNGDRVEIYRPLTADPKMARRRRAGKHR
jgi:putative ubiquitin-RnfH superfamily antitoxin RatB of RatAB toxin-antitoxin module